MTHIRPICENDLVPLGQLLRAIAQFNAEEVGVAEELLAGAVSDPEGSGYHALVVEDDGEVAGYVCFGPTPMTQSTYDLYWIAVDPGRQGRGLGRALYAGFAAQLRAKGGAQVRIETSSRELYAATGGFYERLGFQVDGRLRDFYAPGDDLLIFYRKV